MAAGGPVDPTMPLPGGERRGAPVPPEVPAEPEVPTVADATGADPLPGSYDPTIAVPPVVVPDGPGGPDDGDPYGPGPDGGDEEPDNKKWLWGILAALGVIILGVIIALLLSGGGDDGDKPSSTSSSSSSSSTSTSSTSTSTSTTSTTATTVPGAPVITSFSSNPATTVQCDNASQVVQITLTWATSNANGVTITIDGGNTATFGPSGSAARDFNCAQTTHAYTLTAVGANNATTTRTITLNRAPIATTSTSSTTTTTKAGP